jgi:hypothetical protein
MQLKISSTFSSWIFARRFEVVICLLVVGAFVLRSWGASSGLPLLNIKDEGQMVPAAVRFGSGDLNPHSFTYPSLFKYLLFFLYGGFFVVGRIFGKFASVDDFKLHYFHDPSDFYVIARLCSAVLGSLTVLMVYLIGRQIHSKKVGLLAALFFAVDFQHVRYSHLAKPDAAMVFLLVTAIYFAVRIATAGKLRDYLLAGALGGLAISAKYNAITVTVAIAAAHLLRNPDENVLKNLKTNFHYLAAAMSLVVIFFFVGTPFALLDFKTFLRDLEFIKHVVTRGDAGHNYISTMGFYLQELFLPGQWSWNQNYLGVILLAGLVVALFRRQRVEGVILAFVVAHFIYFTYKTSSQLPKPHYLLPMMPVMFIFGAKLFELAFQKIKADAFQNVLLFGGASLFLIPSASQTVMFDYELAQTSTDQLARQWVLEQVPAGTRILQVGRHDLALRENRASLLENLSDSPEEVLEAKLNVLKKYTGKTYYIQHLNPGWNVTEEMVESMKEMPLGVDLPEQEALALSYWRDKQMDYVVIMGERQRVRESFEEVVHVSLREFNRQLEIEVRLIKEFIPEPPQRPGRWIRIYQLSSAIQHSNHHF